MHIFNVRKGQFVYYQNQLHKVYSVKPFFKKSVHLLRVKDFKQRLVTAKEIDLYKPKHLDRFTFKNVVYTLNKEKRAEVGDYILVVYPSPDYLDHHYLNAIEMVAEVEANGIISAKSNGIKHREYWVMVPEIWSESNDIDIQDPTIETEEEEELVPEEVVWPQGNMPYVGDVFKHLKSDPPMKTMVIATKDPLVYLGGGFEVTKDELANVNEWQYEYHVSEE